MIDSKQIENTTYFGYRLSALNMLRMLKPFDGRGRLHVKTFRLRPKLGTSTVVLLQVVSMILLGFAVPIPCGIDVETTVPIAGIPHCAVLVRHFWIRIRRTYSVFCLVLVHIVFQSKRGGRCAFVNMEFQLSTHRYAAVPSMYSVLRRQYYGHNGPRSHSLHGIYLSQSWFLNVVPTNYPVLIHTMPFSLTAHDIYDPFGQKQYSSFCTTL